MTLKIADRVKETTTTAGTGNITLAGAMTGFQAFSSALANSDTCYYALQSVDASGNPTGAWEVGLGTYTSSGNTLSRTLIASSTGSLISLSGTTQVWIDVNASRFVATNAAPSAGQIPLYSAGGLYAPTAYTMANLTDTDVVEASYSNGGVIGYVANTGKMMLQPIGLSIQPNTTFDPNATSSSLTLSNGNLTITPNATGSFWYTARTRYPKTSGKWYAEFTINTLGTASGDRIDVGLINGIASLTDSGSTFPGSDTNGVSIYSWASPAGNNGLIYNNTTQLSGAFNVTTGSVVGVAVDFSLKRAWFFNPVTGKWNGDVLANQNPATGTGGFDLTTILSNNSTLFLAAAELYGTTAPVITMNPGTSAFSNTRPAGFLPWSSNAVALASDVSAPSPTNANLLAYWSGLNQWTSFAPTLGSSTTTLDPAVVPSNITLSNGNLTITGSGSGWSWARSLNPRSTGKYYAECLINLVAGGVGFGLANASEATVAGTVLGHDTNGVMFYNAPLVPDSGIFYNNADVAGSTPTTPPTTGATIGMAVDLGAKKVWFYNPASGLWNNAALSSQNPATGTGGFDLTTIMSGGALYLGVAKQTATGVPTCVATLNVGAKAFVNPVPTGFGPWDSLAPLADVSVTSPADGDIMIYKSATGKWTNQTKAQARATLGVGRVLLAEVSVSPGVATASVSLDGYFTSEFDSYTVEFMGIQFDSGNTIGITNVQMNVGGSVVTTANYNYGWRYVNTAGTAYGAGSGSTPATAIQLHNGLQSALSGTAFSISGHFNIFDPLKSVVSGTYSPCDWYLCGPNGSTSIAYYDGAGFYNATSAISGLTFKPGAGNFVNGKFKLYGNRA